MDDLAYATYRSNWVGDEFNHQGGRQVSKPYMETGQTTINNNALALANRRLFQKVLGLCIFINILEFKCPLFQNKSL